MLVAVEVVVSLVLIAIINVIVVVLGLSFCIIWRQKMAEILLQRQQRILWVVA